MHLTERILGFTLLGSEWVLWLLFGLSVLSVAIMVERGLFLRDGDDADALSRELARAAANGDVAGAAADRQRQARAGRDRGGLRPRELQPRKRRGLGGDGRHEGAPAHRPRAQPRRPGDAGQQRPLHRPVRHGARHHQGLRRPLRATPRAAAPAAVMSGISEALVATAVGPAGRHPGRHRLQLLPGQVRKTMARIDAVAHLVLVDHPARTHARSPRAARRGREATPWRARTTSATTTPGG